LENHSILLFIQDLAIVMVVAGFITILCRRFNQPMVLGYIIAGIIIGPYTPPISFISNEDTMHTLAELGIIFLMFSLGLEFNLRKLSKVGLAASIAAFAEIVLMMWLGYEIGRLFEWEKIDSLFLGAILAISSTTIIIKTLTELGMKKEPFAQLIFGILIIEDIFAILILTLLAGIALTGSLNVGDMILNITKLSSFLVISLLLGILLIPKLLAYIAKFNNDEVLLISVLGLCFGFCLLVVTLDYSVALGAFIMGAVIAESKQLNKIEHLISPLRDMFSAIFFVSVGLLFDPQILVHYWEPLIIITIAVILGKILTCSLGVLITGQNGNTAMHTGMGLAQIGEFSFIIAGLGITLNVTGEFLYPIAVAVSVITTFLTPYLIRSSDTVTQWTKAIIPHRVASIFNTYQMWLQNIRPREHKQLMKIIKRSLLQVLINLLVVMGIFLSGAYFATTKLMPIIIPITDERIQVTLIWSAALLISLPFLIAAYRKIKALSMIIAEVSVRESVGHQFTPHARKVISEVIPITAIMSIMIFICALSSSILPPIKLLIVVLVIAALLIGFILPWCIKFHSRLQISLIDTLTHDDEKK
jgi:CPA2 family monovalent cation:H+ antiporter-2